MKLLCLDGGGIFGIVQATILSRTSDLKKYDVIGGTSIGSVVGAIVALGDPIIQANIIQFFNTWMPKIFKGYIWRKYGFLTPRYSDTDLVNALKTLFPTQKFKDLKIPMFIPAVDLNGRRLKVFYSRDAVDGELMLWEVLRSATAAETYFLPWKGVADGGIFANDPIMVTIAGAQTVLGTDSTDMAVCSIGTGVNKWMTPVKSTNYWTKLSWASYLIDATLIGAAGTMHEYFAENMGLKKYLRFQFTRDDDWDMDDASIMSEVLTSWKNDIDEAVKQIESF